MPPKEIHEDFMETLSKVKKLATDFKRSRESVEEDGRSGRLKDATANESVKVVHTLVIVRPANRDWACQTEHCHTLSNKASLK